MSSVDEKWGQPPLNGGCPRFARRLRPHPPPLGTPTTSLLILMLSMTTLPGPTSVPSSKTMLIDVTFPVTPLSQPGKALNGVSNLISHQPVCVSWVFVPCTQPRKQVPPATDTTLNRGAPAPQ